MWTLPSVTESYRGHKLAPSIPFTAPDQPGSQEEPVTTSGSQEQPATAPGSGSQQQHTTASASCVISELCCSKCDQQMTPMMLHVVAYITKHMQPKQVPRKQDTRKVKPTVYGEVLTSDEVMAQLEEDKRKKEEKVAEKAAKKLEQAEKAAQKKADKQ